MNKISLFAAIPALFLAAHPALAQDRSTPANGAVQASDARWSGAPEQTAAAERLIGLLEYADFEGYAEGPALAAQAKELQRKAAAGDAMAARGLATLLDRAYLDYVTTLQAEVPYVEYGDGAQIPRRFSRTDHQTLLTHAPNLDTLVRQQTTMNVVYEGLRQQAHTYGRSLEPEAKDALRGTLMRLRALPKRNRFVLVDIASQRLWMYDGGQPVDSMKVVVGRNEISQGIDSRTPMIMSTIHYATHNPYWHVPFAVLRKTVGNNIKNQGNSYLKSRGYEIVDRWANDAAILSPADVDWSTALSVPDALKVRQLPGGANSMGNFKFNFPNATGIYLHDTPMKTYFNETDRARSNGCIRLEDARRFASWLYKGQGVPDIDAAETHDTLPEGVPVFVTYMTAQAVDGSMSYAADVYGFDGNRERVAEIDAAAEQANRDEAANL
ncbi:L,D-transpeptidase family protein [Sphingomicrobium sp. XHP0239]|uniref:L,D-transpeptidase family protein n=1 Tax=Sphingomicrobium maritimum TaxID=3133972 RepID=UPI0031CCC856